MSGVTLQQKKDELVKAAHENLQKALELQQLNTLKERRCRKCNRLLCKSEGRTEVKCKCGHLNLFTD